MCDLILFNAHAITMDPVYPIAELIAIDAGKISRVGGNELLGSLKSKEVQIIDCAGMTLMPGFIDAHCHLQAYAEQLVSLNLSPREKVGSISDIQERIRSVCSSLPPGTWVRAKSYNEFYLAEKRHPNRWDLDASAPCHPVKLTHRSGHAHVLNSLALQMAGIGEETGDPPEGLIDRDPETGLPTGVLYGMGEYLSEKIPRLPDPEMRRGVKSASGKLISYGITSIQDASISNGPERGRRFDSWKTGGLLQPRVTMMTGLSEFRKTGRGGYPSQAIPGGLRLGAVKIIADEVTGSLHPSQDELNEAVSEIHVAGRQAAIHAIEEPVIEAAANAIEFAVKKKPRRDHRHRLEHCSLCAPPLLRRLAALGAVVVTQPAFIFYSGDRYIQTVAGDQVEDLYPVRSMLDSGLLAAAGSDFPIAEPNPLLSIGAAVTRRTESGAALTWQRISVPDALRMHTINAAAAAFEEGIKGSLTPGKLADLVMLSENPLDIDPDHIKDILVLKTIVDGRILLSI